MNDDSAEVDDPSTPLARLASEPLDNSSTTGRAFARFLVGGSRSGDDGSRNLVSLVRGQVLWMVVAFVLLVALEMWSLRLYFIVSFIGLLTNRLLFAPEERERRWWRLLRLVVFAGFLVFAYVVYLRVQAVVG